MLTRYERILVKNLNIYEDTNMTVLVCIRPCMYFYFGEQNGA